MTRLRLTIFTLLALSLSDGLAAEDSPSLNRKIQGKEDNLEPVEKAKDTPQGRFVESVVRVEDISDGLNRAYGYCTGAKVGDHLFLTNFHCDRPCLIMQFRAGYKATEPESAQPTYRCSKLLVKNEQLDYALYEAKPSNTEGGGITLPNLCLFRGDLHKDQRVIVASFPGGRPMELDRSQECVLSSVDVYRTDNGRDTIQHMCDTEGGSSGAPLIDYYQGFGVGLHWAGESNAYNMAIPMPLIVRDLEEKLPSEVTAKIQFCN